MAALAAMFGSMLHQADNAYLCLRECGSSMSAVLKSEEKWSLLDKKIQDFQLRSSVLYKVLKYANGRGHYQELFVQLDINGFYAG